jgi:iron complex transport system substrate-binding protein
MPIRLAAVLGALVLSLAACGDDDAATTATTTAVPATTAAPAPAFPVVVTAENGDVELAAAPQRIVSLSASLTELLFAVGAGDQVLAVDQHSDFPAGTPVTDLSGFRPNVEAIAGYEPDLVVVANDRDGVVEALAGLGIPTLWLPSADGLDDVYREIGVLGEATGHVDGAAALAGRMRADLAAIESSVPEREQSLRYFYELSDSFHSATSDTFIGEVLGLAGLTSIADGVDPAAGGFPQLSAEYVLDADPDVIFLAHTDGTGRDPAEVAARPGWGELRAVKNGGVVVLDTDVSTRWGPRIVDLLRSVVDVTNTIAR